MRRDLNTVRNNIFPVVMEGGGETEIMSIDYTDFGTPNS